MPQSSHLPTREKLQALWAGLDAEKRRKVTGLALALGIEGLLILLLLSLSAIRQQDSAPDEALVTFTASAPGQPEQAADANAEPDPPAESPPELQSETPETEPDVPQVEPPAVETRPPALIPISPETMRETDIAKAPSPAAPREPQVFGPVNRGFPGDSERLVGSSGPNGKPLYAARWYRKPYPDELRGYLSTASGPGWGLINCRTAPNFRVENCVLVGESPEGSGIGRAVLAAAWQFKVRPPQIGGRPQVGEWVRIRIDYEYSTRVPGYAR